MPSGRTEARAAEALVLASRQAIGLFQTVRGLRVCSPLPMCSLVKIQERIVPVDCASRRSRITLGVISSRLRTNMNVM